MENVRVVIFLACLVLTCVGCTSKIIVQRVPATPTQAYVDGIVYALPRTIVQVQVPVTKTTRTRGRFCDCIAGATTIPKDVLEIATKACDDSKVKVSLEAKSATLAIRGVADPAQVFSYRVTGGLLEDRNATLNFVDDMIITDGEAETTNNTLDLTLKVVSAAAGVGAKFIAADAAVSAAATCSAGEAESAWQEIAALTLQRNALVREVGTATIDGAAFVAALKDIDERIASLRQVYFLGASNESILWTGNFELNVPDTSSGTEEYELFRMLVEGDGANKAGLCGGTPAPVDNLQPADDLPPCAGTPTVVTLNLQNARSGVSGLLPGNAREPSGDRGFRYRIPAPYAVSVKSKLGAKTKQVARMELQIAQRGTVVALPPGSGGRRTKYSVTLNPATGALKNFKLGSDALLQKSNIDDVNSASTAVIDAKQKAAQKKKDNADELNQLIRERSILEEKVKIRDAQSKLP